MWKQDTFVVMIVNKSHPEYINWVAKSGYHKLGDVMYIYRSGTKEIGKVGCFQSANDFLSVWSPC